MDPSPERCGICLISVLQSAIKAVTRLLRTRSLYYSRCSKSVASQSGPPNSRRSPDSGYSTSPLFIAASPRYLASIWFQAQATTGLCFIKSNLESTRSGLTNVGQPGDESETPVGLQKPQMPFRDSIVHFNSITCTSFDAIISDH